LKKSPKKNSIPHPRNFPTFSWYCDHKWKSNGIYNGNAKGNVNVNVNGFKVLCVVVHFLQKNNDMRFIVVYFPKLSITVKEFMNASWKKGSVFCCLCVTQVLSLIQKELLMVEMELNLWSCRCLGIRNKLKALESCMH